MIVQINENNSEKYRKLFTEAYKFLEDLNNGTVISGKGRFSNLAEYYGHIADLFNEQKYEYIMVPLDEDPFVIDLNKRTIAVPASFSKCASVQTDTLAETIVFVADRYFDFMDLANVQIYVQWTTPTGFKGATRVEMRDLDSEPGKIKFAWPLNAAVTEVPGPVKFAVRFFRVDPNTSELVYSLNTLEAEIVIKNALQPEGPSAVEKPIDDNLFAKAILNSNYSATGVNPPVQPIYAAPGSDISIKDAENKIILIPSVTEEIGYMKMNSMTQEKFDAGDYWTFDGTNYNKADTFDENKTYFIQIQKGIKYVGLNNNTLTLYAQAIAMDDGEITYKWFYRAQDGEYSDKAYDCEDIGFGRVNHWTMINVGKDPANENHDIYYKLDTNAPYGYSEYVGTFPATEDVFERYTSLTIPADSESSPVAVTGLYYASAWNTKDASGYTRIDNLTKDRFDAGVFYIKTENGSYEDADDFDANTIYYAKVENYISVDDLDEETFNKGEFYIMNGNKYVRAYEYNNDADYYKRGRGLLTTNFPTDTTTCLLPGPREIIISDNLENAKIFDESKQITLTVGVKEDNYDPEITYSWKKSTTSADDVFTSGTTVSSGTGITSSYLIAESDNNDGDGWYGVNITSKLNRKEETISSNVVKVTHDPVPPQVVYLGEQANKIFGTLDATHKSVTFQVDVDQTVLNTVNNPLKCEKINYIWQMRPADLAWQPLSGQEKGVTIEDNKITITSDFATPYASFRCLTVNVLNGKTAVFDHSSDLAQTDGEKLGIYTPSVPHIFANNKSFEFILSNQ